MAQRLFHAAMTRLCVRGMWSVLLLLFDCFFFCHYFIFYNKSHFMHCFILSHVLFMLVCFQTHIVSSSFAPNASLVQMLSKFSASAIDLMTHLRTFMSPTMCDRIREGFKATIAPSEDELRILAPSLSMFDCQLNVSVVVSGVLTTKCKCEHKFETSQKDQVCRACLLTLFSLSLYFFLSFFLSPSLLQAATLTRMQPLFDCLMDLHATLPIQSLQDNHSTVNRRVEVLESFLTCLQPESQQRLNHIVTSLLKGVTNKNAELVTSSSPVHPLEVVLALNEAHTDIAHSMVSTRFQRQVVHELQFVCADSEVLRQCVLALRGLEKQEVIEIVEVTLAYGIPEGWFGGEVIFNSRENGEDMMIRVRFECLPQLPSITWSNVGWFTRVLSQFRSHRRMAAQVMARVGKEQQVKDVENRSIANFKESLEQGLILHPLLLRRYFSVFRTVQVCVFLRWIYPHAVKTCAMLYLKHQ
jgi:hypothetical protein